MIVNNHLGTECFWWRETGEFHTLISLYGGYYDVDEPLRYVAVLLDASGVTIAEWFYDASTKEPVHIDSRDYAHLGVEDGVLAIFVCAEQQPSEYLRNNYMRLYGCIDWFSDNGDLCTLHSDQSTYGRSMDRTVKLGITEIILDIKNDISNYLVIVNGHKKQSKGAVTLTVQNYLGEEMTAIYPDAMSPLSLHKVFFDELFPELEGFSKCKPVSVKGKFEFSGGHFCRPYVVSESKYMCAYHGGNLYSAMEKTNKDIIKGWRDMPGNPFFVIHNDSISTRLNIFNSHSSDGSDLWVDLRAFDQQGRLIVKKDKYIFIKRDACITVDVNDILPGNGESFIGHIALNYHPDTDKEIPGVQQCLVEYYTAETSSKVMLWSDAWNSDSRQLMSINYKSYQRAWISKDIKTWFAIVNNSIHLDYSLTAEYVVRVLGKKQELTFTRTVAPHATDYFCIEDLHPDICNTFKEQDVVMVFIESQRDLANVQLTFRDGYNVCAAEHTVALLTIQDGNTYNCTGG